MKCTKRVLHSYYLNEFFNVLELGYLSRYKSKTYLYYTMKNFLKIDFCASYALRISRNNHEKTSKKKICITIFKVWGGTSKNQEQESSRNKLKELFQYLYFPFLKT